MLDNWKISARQFKYLIILCFIGTSIVLIPSTLANQSKQDAWLAALVGTIIGVLLVWLHTTLGSLYPNLTLTQKNEKILGKKLGKTVSLLYILYLFVDCTAIIWVSGNFLTTQILIETPIQYTNIFFIIVVVIGARLGLESFARSGELLLPIVIILFIMLIVFTLPNIEHYNNIQPIMENGMKPIFRGAIYFISFTVLTNFVFLMIFPANTIGLNDSKKAFFKGTIIAGLMLIIITLLCIIVLGVDFTARNAFPTYTLAKKIHLANFLQRIEIVIAIIWLITVFYKTIVFFYGITYGLAQIFDLKNYQSLTLPLGMIFVVSSLVLYPSSVYFDEWFSSTWLPFIIIPGIVYPLLLYIIGKFRKNLKSDIKAKE